MTDEPLDMALAKPAKFSFIKISGNTVALALGDPPYHVGDVYEIVLSEIKEDGSIELQLRKKP